MPANTIQPVHLLAGQPVTVAFSDSEILEVIPLNNGPIGDNLWGRLRRAVRIVDTLEITPLEVTL